MAGPAEGWTLLPATPGCSPSAGTRAPLACCCRDRGRFWHTTPTSTQSSILTSIYIVIHSIWRRCLLLAFTAQLGGIHQKAKLSQLFPPITAEYGAQMLLSLDERVGSIWLQRKFLTKVDLSNRRFILAKILKIAHR